MLHSIDLCTEPRRLANSAKIGVLERYGFACLPGNLKLQDISELCCVKLMDFMVETKTSKDSGLISDQWSMVPASGIRTTVAGPFRGFLLRPLSNGRCSETTEDLFIPVYSYGCL